MTEEQTEKETTVEHQLVEELQEFIAANLDVKLDPELKEKIDGFTEGTLVKVVKEIGSSTTIISAEDSESSYGA